MFETRAGGYQLEWWSEKNEVIECFHRGDAGDSWGPQGKILFWEIDWNVPELLRLVNPESAGSNAECRHQEIRSATENYSPQAWRLCGELHLVFVFLVLWLYRKIKIPDEIRRPPRPLRVTWIFGDISRNVLDDLINAQIWLVDPPD
jgi:hypothetical protein